MPTRSARIALLIFIVTQLAFPTASFAQGAAPAEDAKQGQQIFKAIGCWECHGSVGQGGGTAGPRLAATGLPYDAFQRQLRVPRNAMPPYEAKLVSDSEVASIYAYVRALPEPKPAKDIPLLNALK
jgi:ubiquinol-cytochrome c reductase cytochrome c subunit